MITQQTEEVAAKLLDYLENNLGGVHLEYASLLTQMRGGMDTSMYQFQLTNGSQGKTRKLALRLFPFSRTPNEVLKETYVQNSLFREGYPSAAVHTICLDKFVLGGCFFIMDFLPGEVVATATTQEEIPLILAEAHNALHQIN